MGLAHSPRIVTEGLVLALDVGNTKSFLDAPPQGQQAYTTSGTHSWTCPAGVYSVSAVVVGGGGGAGGGYAMGGGGGGLAYKNNISVTPGQSYTVVVGSGGAGATDDGDSSIWTMALGSDGGDSYFVNTSTVRATGGSAATSTNDPAEGGTNTAGDGGGSGGLADISGGGYHWAGGGAGGYSGDGGRTGSSSSSYSGHSGTNYYGHDGAGGGGGGGGYSSGHGQSGGGGGVGLLGEGASGSGGTGGSSVTGGGGGSGGSSGTISDGGNYGGGGGSQYTVGGDGAVGAVRIIWGSGRSFPSTNTADVVNHATNWGDTSGKGNNGTLVNGPSYSTTDGGYFDFDGTNDYVIISDTSDFSFESGEFAIEAWFRPDPSATVSTSSYHTILISGVPVQLYWINNQFQFFGSTSNNLSPPTYFIAGNTGFNSGSNSAARGVWHHIVVTRTGNDFKMYLNGTLVAHVVNSSSFGDANIDATIGATNTTGLANYANGRISNLKVYKGKGLTASEVLQNYNAIKGRYV